MAKRIGADKTRRKDTLAAALGSEITRLRIEQRLSQLKFSELLGYDERYIRQLERGEKSPTLRTLSAIATAFKIPVSTLIRRAERYLAASRKGEDSHLASAQSDK